MPDSWNFTASPGWTKEEAGVLKLCLMKYGIGRWKEIQETGLLPGKLIQQLNGQTQRLLGQQSLAGKLTCYLCRLHRSVMNWMRTTNERLNLRHKRSLEKRHFPVQSDADIKKHLREGFGPGTVHISGVMHDA